MASTTAATIISDALAEIGILGEGETASGDQIDRGLRMLNRLLDTLSNDSVWAYFASSVSRPLTGEASFTIGPTGDIVGDRPIEINAATVIVNGITYPVKVIDNERFDVLTYKALKGAYTSAIYYEGTFPNGTVYCYPMCSGATLNMRILNSVKQFAGPGDQIEMPEGYEDAIMLALAVRMCPSYNRAVSPDTKQAAAKAMKTVKQTNVVVPTLDLPEAVMGKSGGSYAAFMSGG